MPERSGHPVIFFVTDDPRRLESTARGFKGRGWRIFNSSGHRFAGGAAGLPDLRVLGDPRSVRDWGSASEGIPVGGEFPVAGEFPVIVLDATQGESGSSADLEAVRDGLPEWFRGAPVLVFLAAENILESGLAHADEVMVWPGTPEEAIARVERLAARRSRCREKGDLADGPPEGRLAVGDLVLDLHRLALYRGGSEIPVTRTEFDLLTLLASANGRALARREILDSIWGEDYFVGSNVVDAHVKSLRRKLGDCPDSPRYIATVRGVGYRLLP